MFNYEVLKQKRVGLLCKYKKNLKNKSQNQFVELQTYLLNRNEKGVLPSADASIEFCVAVDGAYDIGELLSVNMEQATDEVE